MRRVVILVLDSFGIGDMPDAHKYGDEGSDTLGNIARNMKGFRLPNLESLGLANIDGVEVLNSRLAPLASYGRMMERSPGKDTTTGHWELTGIVLDRPFPTYPNGFPRGIIEEFERAIGRSILGNYSASGTEIIKELGKEHMETGFPIVYTSADSVFQVASHEDIISLDELYDICQKARDILKGEDAVGRVIARPFVGEPGNFTRTFSRRDFSLKPIEDTILDKAYDKGLRVSGVGKIRDIFSDRGISDNVYTEGNMDGIDRTIERLEEDFEGIIFTNLIDFDMLYGHRRDIEGYGGALMELDSRIPDILEALKEDDILMITADHGCDPSMAGTDHTREYVPLIVYGRNIKAGVNLGTRASFADLAASIAEYLGLGSIKNGESFLSDIS